MMARRRTALDELNINFQYLLANNPLPMWVYDRRTLEFLEVNDAAIVQYGYTRAEFLAMQITDIRPTEDIDRLSKSIVELGPGLRNSGEWRHRRKDGEVIDVHIVSHTLEFAGREAALVVAQDITEQKRAEREVHALNKELEDRVRRRTAQLEAANQELEAFAYSVAHDLRSPLITIGGFSQILLEDHVAALPEDARRLLAQIASSTQHMSSLINDLLALSRLGRQPIRERPISPADVVRQAIAELDGTGGGGARGIRVDDLPRCQADPGLLQQVYVNLLSNALKFSRNRKDPLVEVGWRQDPNEPAHYTYFVRDNGVGFDMQYADKLFRVFQRLHRQEDYEGTGVGLAIVQRVIRRHGGRVWAEGEVGKGATFYFTLARSDAP
ncbi:MAG TPA: ATP-binding protein [bacterium]|nr:ATP-binding protein [bacterium]